MKRTHDCTDLPDLGAVSAKTKGATEGNDDHVGGLIKKQGLSND